MADTSVSYKCPNCGAPLSFLPGAENVTCEYCGAEFTIAAIEEMFQKEQERAAKAEAAKEAKFDAAMAGGEWTEEEAAALKTLTCSSCGAELVCDENTMATECCYCGNPTMLPGRFDGSLKPDLVIPFKKTKEDAVAALKKFYEGKKLLPDAFTANNRIEDIQAMYVPFWLFNTDVSAEGEYSAENDSVTSTSDRTITVTSFYKCQREGEMSFEKVPVDGSVKMDDTYMESIEPFDYSEMVPFSASYLTGYLADKYDVEAEDAAGRADERISNSAKAELAKTVTGYDRVTGSECIVTKNDSSMQYAMVPVWILTTRFEDVPYTFMLNGQTGKFIGQLPIDKGKEKKYGAIAFAASLPVMYFVGKFLAAMFLG